MGKYDVTVGQYCQFLNAVAATDTYGLYNSYMATLTTVSTVGIVAERQSGQLHLLGFVHRQRVEQLRRLQLQPLPVGSGRGERRTGIRRNVGRCGAVRQLAAKRAAD